MIKVICFILILLVGLNPAEAKNTVKKASKTNKTAVTKKGTAKSTDGQLGTSFSFDAASVRGKYQMAGQGIALVEDEKVLDDLLGVRKQFRDREQQESSRR